MGLLDGQDAVLDDFFTYQMYNAMKNHWPGTSRPSSIVAGMIWYKSDTKVWYGWEGAADKELAIVGAHTLASHSTKAHSELTGVTANQHHAQLHASSHHSGGSDQIAFASINGFSSYLDQAVKQASSPTFNDLDLDGDLTFNGSGMITTSGASTYLNLEPADLVRSQRIYGTTSAGDANVIVQVSPYNIIRSTSAKKYKDKVKDLELDSSLIYSLRAVSYNSLCRVDDKNKRFHGFLADEIEQIYPEIVEHNEDGEVENYDRQMFMALLFNEIKRLHQEIEILKSYH